MLSSSNMPRISAAGPFACAAALLSLIPAIARADAFYVTDSTQDVITRINRIGFTTSFPAGPSGLVEPQQVVLDAAGNAFVADSGLGKVMRFPADGSTPVQEGNDVPGVNALAFSPSGVLHVCSGTDDTIRKLSGNTFQMVATVTANAVLRSIAFDTNGDLYAADNAGSRIFKITPAGGQSVYSTAVSQPFAVAFDTAGKLHVTDAMDGGRIATFTGNGNNSRLVIGNLGSPRGLAFDKGNIAHYLTASGDLRRVNGSATAPVAEGLGTVQLLTARGPSVTAVAHTGTVVTSEPIKTLAPPAIGNGQLAFKGVFTTGGNVTAANSLGLFRSQMDGEIDVLARKSFPAPGMTVGQVVPILNAFGDPILNNSGRVAFIGTLRAGVGNVTSADSIAVFSDFDGGQLRPVLRRNQNNLGNNLDPAVKFTAFKQLVLPDDSGPAVIATMSGPGVTSATATGLWSLNSAGELSLLLRSGTLIMAGGKERKVGAITMFTPTPMSLGQSRHFGENQTFVLSLKFTDGFPAIVRVKPGMAPEVLAERFADVGAAVPEAKLNSFGSPAVAANGDIAFRALLAVLPNVVTAATAPVILTRAATNAKVVRQGESEPDVQGAFFASIGDPVYSASGTLAFFGKLRPGLGSVTTTNAAGLWQDLDSGLHNVVRQSDPAAGIPGAVKFTAFKQFVLPATGGVVFIATISGDGITAANNLGIWANDGAGATDVLLRKGDKLTVDGKMRTVIGFKIFQTAIGVAGQSRSFEDSGAVACHVTFSDLTQAVLLIRRP